MHNALEKNRLVILIIINIDNVSFDFLVRVFFLCFSLCSFYSFTSPRLHKVLSHHNFNDAMKPRLPLRTSRKSCKDGLNTSRGVVFCQEVIYIMLI